MKRHHNEEVTVDLAIFDLDEDRWWVGRVVPRVEDLEFEVLIPTLALRRTTYLSADVDRIIGSADTTRDVEIDRIVHAQVPGVVTFVSNPDPSWFDRVAASEGLLAILERFSDEAGETMLRLNGSLPTAVGCRLGKCDRVPHTSGIYKLDGVADGIDDVRSNFDLDGEQVIASATVAGEFVTIDLQAVIEDRSGDLVLWEVAPFHYEFRFEKDSND